MTCYFPSLRLTLTIILCLILSTSRPSSADASQPGDSGNATASAMTVFRPHNIDALRPSIPREKPLRPLANGAPPNIYLVDLANGSFASATGGVPEIDNVTAISDTPPTTVGFTLQLNTNTFSSALCKGLVNCAWVQFVYDSGGGVNVQAYLIGYNAAFNTCPSNFSPGGNFSNQTHQFADCENTQNTPNIPQPGFGGLAGTTLSGSFDASGNYVATVLINGKGTPYTATVPDAGLGLAGNWTSIQFNAFAECCTDQAIFNPGALVKFSVSATTSAGSATPTCDGAGGGPTAESSNLVLIPTCNSSGGAAPVFSFLEGTPPIIATVFPPIGVPGGGQNIAISGTGFTTATEASFGGSLARCLTSLSSGPASPNVPAGGCEVISPNRPAGGVELRVANVSDDGTAGPLSAPQSFTYVPPCAATNSCSTPSCGKCGIGLHCCQDPNDQSQHLCLPLAKACPILQ